MKRHAFAIIVAVTLLALFSTRPSSAQVSISVGPHVSTLGIGVAAEARFLRIVGVSAEYNLMPIESVSKSGFGSSFAFEPSWGGAMLMVTLHPSAGKFALGAGLLMGGISADAHATPNPAPGTFITIGDHDYAASGVGSLRGSLEFGSTQPVVIMGWIGRGLNIAFGAALATPEIDLWADGPLKNDPAFANDLNREITDLQDDLDKVPVFPYVRLGWQFGL